VKQQDKLQIDCANRIALLMWHCLSGELNLEPINKLQFCCNASSRTIEHQELQFNPKTYKLSPLSSMHRPSKLKNTQTLSKEA